MKILRYLLILLAVLWGCSDDPTPEENPRIEEVENFVTNGKWRIAYFYDSDEEATEKFADYAFQFLPSGSLVANDGPASVSGTWSVTDRGSSNDDSEELDFNISFATSPLLNELTEDWEVILASNTRVELRHVSGRNSGGTDLLTFEKI